MGDGDRLSVRVVRRQDDRWVRGSIMRVYIDRAFLFSFPSSRYFECCRTRHIYLQAKGKGLARALERAGALKAGLGFAAARGFAMMNE